MRIRTAALLATLALPLFASAQEEEKFPWEEDSPTSTPSPSPSPSPSPPPSPSPSPSATPKPALTKADVIAMSKAKIADPIIIKKIQTSGVVFALEVDDLVALKKAGVSGKVIEAMVATETAPTPEPTPEATATPEETPTPEEEPVDPFGGSASAEPTPTVNPVWLPNPSATPWGRRPVLNGTYDDGFAAGLLEAEEVPVNEWATVGFGGGFCLGAMGCGGAAAGGYFVDMPQKRPEKLDERTTTPEFQEGYQQGYKARLKNRRSMAAFTGGAVGYGSCLLVGAAIFLVSGLAAANEGSKDGQTALTIRF